ncbi:hypothetical protein [Paracoccus fontiphilus]|uniref:hypothetical protein n=1 Tax=Paracoccus fontiphilus TaxID=1815556 RepID=UPI001F621847|nr:hypothetical protein [Paracoccus fontiphilus]
MKIDPLRLRLGVDDDLVDQPTQDHRCLTTRVVGVQRRAQRRHLILVYRGKAGMDDDGRRLFGSGQGCFDRDALGFEHVHLRLHGGAINPVGDRGDDAVDAFLDTGVAAFEIGPLR